MIDLGIRELAAALRVDRTALGRYLDELEARFEAREPSLHAFLPESGRFARLRREAAELHARFPEPGERPPLFGVPLGAKDIFHVEGFTTRAGSRLPAELLQGSEAASVQRLKAAGALILGKTVTTEFAYFAPGPTRNPRNPGHTPGGSSSGSAAAVGAGICPLALGTQTIGSIIRPASFCGVVGFKPSFGRVPTAGVIPLAPSFDHVGFFVRSIADAQWAAGCLCPVWNTEAAARPMAVLAVPTGPYLEHASPEMRACFDAACGKLSAAGFTVKHVAAMSDFAAVRDRQYLIVNAEMARAHRDWFPRLRECYHAKTAEKLDAGRSITDEALARARADRDGFVTEMTVLMRHHAIDAWLSPAAIGPAPAGLESTGDPVMNLPWTQLGFPTVTLPMGAAEALPLGMQLTAAPHDDERLLLCAQALERILAR